jgi:hypothetical protein
MTKSELIASLQSITNTDDHILMIDPNGEYFEIDRIAQKIDPGTNKPFLFIYTYSVWKP